MMVNGPWWPKFMDAQLLTTLQNNYVFKKVETKVVSMFCTCHLDNIQEGTYAFGINIKLPMDAFFGKWQILNIHYEVWSKKAYCSCETQSKLDKIQILQE
jgi:hypothetical protein